MGPAPTSAGRRIEAVDLARGVAILAMVAYHLAWDAWYYGYLDTDVTTAQPWVAVQKAILSSFLLLAGASLVLGHGDGIRWPAFWRRFGLIVAAALATTAGTLVMFPDFFVFFGVLHAIALFSLLGLGFLRLPLPLVALASLLVIAPHFLFAAEVMRERWLAWIGFWPSPPFTTDIVPLFPWFGVVLIGIVAMRLLRRSRAWPRLAGWRAPVAVRWLLFAGRWSLLVYLLHQPLFIGLFTLIGQYEPAVVMPEVLPEGGFGG